MRTSRARVLPAAALALLAGCADMAGLGGTSQYACKAPEGVKCESVSGTYANAIRGNLPSQRPSGADRAPASSGLQTASAAPREIAAPADQEDAPLRAAPRVLRLWIRSYEDAERDLVGAQKVYVRIDSGRWLVDHYQRRTRARFAPLKPPLQAATADGPRAAQSASPSGGEAPFPAGPAGRVPHAPTAFPGEGPERLP